MEIYIDGDACSKTKQILPVAKKYQIPVHFYCDTNHCIDLPYGTVHLVDPGLDAVDFAILNRIQKGDLVITNDAGLASLALMKDCHALNNGGVIYTKENIGRCLKKSYLSKMARRRGGKHSRSRGPRPNCTFYQAFCQLLEANASPPTEPLTATK